MDETGFTLIGNVSFRRDAVVGWNHVGDERLIVWVAGGHTFSLRSPKDITIFLDTMIGDKNAA